MLGLSLFATTATADTIEQAAQKFSKPSPSFSPSISPSGKYITFKAKVEGKDVLAILTTKDLKIIHGVKFRGNRQVGDYHWVNNERLVVTKEYLKGWSTQPQYYGEMFAVNADGSKPTNVFGHQAGEQQTGSHIKKKKSIRASGFMLDPLVNDKKYMLISAIPWGNDFSRTLNYDLPKDVYKVDVYKGFSKKQMRAPVGNTQFLTDNDGTIRFAVGRDKNNDYQLYTREDKKWIHSDKFNHIKLAQFKPISFSADNQSVYALALTDNTTEALYKLNLKTGEHKKIIQDEHVDTTNVWLDNNKQLYAIEFENGYPTYTFVDKENADAKSLKQLLASLPGHQVRIVSQTHDGNKLILSAFNDRNPGDFYLFDRKNVKLSYLFSHADWLNPDDMAEVKPIKFTNRDGQTIHGYLTLPHGIAAKNLPMIVNPHGGPHGHESRDWWGFDKQNQFLASQGYAVLQVNFRGTGGYGQAFEASGYQKWGTDIQHDIIDGTRYVINEASPIKISYVSSEPVLADTAHYKALLSNLICSNVPLALQVYTTYQ